MAAGLVQGHREVGDAGTALANRAINATNERSASGRPSKVFIGIGKQVVAGFTAGHHGPGGLELGYRCGRLDAHRLKNTISEMFTNARSWLGGIIEAFKTLYRVISEDLTPAVGDL